MLWTEKKIRLYQRGIYIDKKSGLGSHNEKLILQKEAKTFCKPKLHLEFSGENSTGKNNQIISKRVLSINEKVALVQ